MALDMKKLAGAPGIRCSALERWVIDGHEVALVAYRRKGGRGPGNAYLACECDTDTEDVVRDGKVIGHTCRRDPHKCLAKATVRELVTERVRPSCLAALADDGIEAAALGIHARVKAGEWLGQAHAGIIYAQEVANLLNETVPKVLAAIESLYAKEKIDLNGMILCDFTPGFRFPKEIRSMLRMMVEAPLGWPNGDAGDIAIAEMETAITKGTRYARCADAFWDHNWPRVAPSHLVEFAVTFLSTALSRAKADATASHDLRFTDCARLAKMLEKIAAEFREFGAVNGFPMDPTKERARPAAKKPRAPRRKPKNT
jgi:hypothetical protein